MMLKAVLMRDETLYTIILGGQILSTPSQGSITASNWEADVDVGLGIVKCSPIQLNEILVESECKSSNMHFKTVMRFLSSLQHLLYPAAGNQ